MASLPGRTVGCKYHNLVVGNLRWQSIDSPAHALIEAEGSDPVPCCPREGQTTSRRRARS